MPRCPSVDHVNTGRSNIVNEVFKSEYEKAFSILKEFMEMIARHVAWPNDELVRFFTGSFAAILDGLYREQVLLVHALRDKDSRIRELEAAEWAELEELSSTNRFRSVVRWQVLSGTSDRIGGDDDQDKGIG
jgi:hypothetical protein